MGYFGRTLWRSTRVQVIVFRDSSVAAYATTHKRSAAGAREPEDRDWSGKGEAPEEARVVRSRVLAAAEVRIRRAEKDCCVCVVPGRY